MNTYFYLETYGCQMNKAESCALAGELKAAGYQETTDPLQAAWIIVNTCSVRQTAEDKVLGRLGYFKTLKKNSDIKLAVMGCMGERLKDMLLSTCNVDIVIGNFNKKIFINHLKNIIAAPMATHSFKEAQKPKIYDFFSYHYPLDTSHAYVPIMHGCNNFCSYCIVPYVRGREISRPPQDIITELQSHTNAGIKEITLLGQNVNSYCYEQTDFVALLRRISQELTGSPLWLRFLSSHPKDLNPALLDILNTDPRFCRHLHLAVQHANSRLLKEMNRQHTKEDLIDLIALIRQKWPGVALSTDLMIGFPGETEQDFEELLDFLQQVQFDDAYTYQYNDREGTPASRRTDKVDEATKTRRIQKLINVQRGITQAKLAKRVGAHTVVLVEGKAKSQQGYLLGRNEQNENIIFPGPHSLIGTFVPVCITGLSGQTLLATPT